MTEKLKQKRVGPLRTVGNVSTELGRLYREARRGEIPVADASRLGTILGVLRQCLEAGQLEQRLAELEARLKR